MSRTLVKYVAVLSLALAVGAVPLQALHAQEPPGEEGVAEDSTEVNPSYRISQSPWLQLPVNRQDYPPITAPLRHATGDEKGLSTVVVHNMATGATVELPDTVQEPKSLGGEVSTTPPYQGLLPSGLGLESVFPPDDRARVTPTTGFPWRTVVALFMTFSDGASGGCSGAIIGCPDGHGYHVLTAGHCVYSHAHGGWASSIRVVPALDENYMPYNEAWATYLRSYTGWTSYGYTEDDWALVTLDRNIGDYTGWMGRATAGSGDAMYTGMLNTAGYPCNIYSSECPYPKSPNNSMWFDSDYGRTATEYNHWYWMDTMPGQSGSPVWTYYSSTDSRYIVTVHTSGDDGSGSNHGTRLNNDKYNRIVTWCGADSPPTDRADLVDDGDAWSGFSPTAVRPGATSFHVWSDVRNIGTAASGGFNVTYYASLNTTISTSDYAIGTDSVPSIAAFNYGDSDWSGTFPTGAPDGLYWVGWIIDSGGGVSEFNESNNTAYEGGYHLLVDGTAPSNPSSVSSPSHTVGAWSNDNTIAMNWSGASDGSGSGVYGYSFEWSTSASTLPDAVADTTGNSTTSPALADSGTWYFHIRTVDNVGNWNASAVHLGPFRIDLTAPSNPSSVSSPSHAVGAWSNDNTIAMNWSGASDGSGSGVYGYSFEWSTSASTLPNAVADTTANSVTSPALADSGTWYFHIRTRDNAGNWNATAVHVGPFRLDTTAPSCQVNALPGTQTTFAFPVTWAGSDPNSASGLHSYDIQYRVGSGGVWVNWLLDSLVVSHNFGLADPISLVNGQTYYFRCRSRDNVGNLGAYQGGSGDTWTTIILHLLFLPVVQR